MAPQQPRKPSRKSIAPIASMMYAPVKSRGLAATISRKPVGSTMTQIPTPSRHAPPSCHSTMRGKRGKGGDRSTLTAAAGMLVSSVSFNQRCFGKSVSVANILCWAGDCWHAVMLLSAFLAHSMKHQQQKHLFFLNTSLYQLLILCPMLERLSLESLPHLQGMAQWRGTGEPSPLQWHLAPVRAGWLGAPTLQRQEQHGSPGMW